MKTKKYTRRSIIKKIPAVTAGVFFADSIGAFSRLFRAEARPAGSKIAVVSTKRISPEEIEKMVDKAFSEFGGVQNFIKKGMNVVVKPNIAWNSPPEQAHNTNPHLVEAVVRRCVKSGAKVTVFDRTCNSARLCYKNSGIEEAAKKAGAEVLHIDDRYFTEVKVPGGLRLKELSVYKPVLDADFVINMPIAKHHGSAELTISMKNLMGLLGGRRGFFHYGLHENIVDFTKAIKSDLIICDAMRVLTKHGPNGGSPEDIIEPKKIIMGMNPVTVDAFTATLFGKKPSDIEYIALAHKEKMGEIDLNKIDIKRFSV